MDATDHEVEIRGLYHLAHSLGTQDARAVAALAKRILKLELSHTGAWNFLYRTLGQDEPAGEFESSFTETNFTDRWEWYKGQREKHYVQHEQAKLKAQLSNWRKLFEEQNKPAFEDFAPGLVIIILGIAAVAGLFLVICGNLLQEGFASFTHGWIAITAITLGLLVLISSLAVFLIRRFNRSKNGKPMAPQAAANLRCSAIENHFQQMLDELEIRGDRKISILPAFALFIEPTAQLCPHCGRRLAGHQCASLPANR